MFSQYGLSIMSELRRPIIDFFLFLMIILVLGYNRHLKSFEVFQPL